VPNRIECHVTVSRKFEVDGKPAESLFFKPLQIGLFDEDTPIWIDDREGHSQNDYAIIDLVSFLPELQDDDVSLRHISGGRVTFRRGYAPAPSGAVSRDDVRPLYPMIGAEVFVLGYPRGVTSTGVFPIWKRASIASEPQSSVSLEGTEYNNLFYIDGLTKTGMSGSPVVCLAKPGDEFRSDDDVRVLVKKAEPYLIGVYAGIRTVARSSMENWRGRSLIFPSPPCK
jgi:hypothetical protein